MPHQTQIRRASKTTASRAAQRKATAMRWLRRTHLYSGLLLLPWVLIYGISGFLFNHGGSTSTSQMLPIAADQRAQLSMHSDELGTRLLAALDQQATHPQTTLSGSWTLEFRSPEDDKNYRLSLPIDGSIASLTERRSRSSGSSNIPRDTFAAERQSAEQTARKTLASIGLQPNKIRTVGGPSLRVVAGDKRYATTLTRERVTESNASTFDFNRLMRRLHVTHGYGRSDWSRIAWAVIVDVMAFAMVLWAVSGIAMWWQKKSLRTSGAVALAAAFTGSVVLIVSLQALFSS